MWCCRLYTVEVSSCRKCKWLTLFAGWVCGYEEEDYVFDSSKIMMLLMPLKYCSVAIWNGWVFFMSHQCNGVDPAHDWHYIIGVGKFNCSKDFDAKIMVMMMMTMTMVMIENLEGGRNVAAWRVHVRPPVEHVVGAENQLRGETWSSFWCRHLSSYCQNNPMSEKNQSNIYKV